MQHSPTTAPAHASPDPPQDHPATTLSTNIEFVLHAARGLLGYGRHMFDTVHQRAITPTFSAIAACFGTAKVPTIIAHVARGMLRATALERVLLSRAAAGKDIDIIERHKPEPQPTAAATQPEQQRLEPPAPRKRAPRPFRPAGWDDPELYMPTLEELERQVRRQPIGRTILEICLDLGVVPALCHSAFWNELFDIMNWFGGGNAVDKLMREKARRREAFANEQDRNPKADWNWLRLKRDELQGVLGFFIGEPPINPFDPAAAIATAPP